MKTTILSTGIKTRLVKQSNGAMRVEVTNVLLHNVKRLTISEAIILGCFAIAYIVAMIVLLPLG